MTAPSFTPIRYRDGPSVDDVVATLDRDGFAVVEGMLSKEEAAAKRAELTRILAETPSGRNDFEGYSTRRIYALFAKTRAFDEPATHPLVLGVLDHFLKHYQLSAPVGIEIHPGETAQNLHRDDGVYPIIRPHDELVVNTMWALDDFTEANGATRVAPGTHRLVNEAPDASTPVVVAEMPAGSVMFFLGSVYHGGGANTTDRPRLGTILHYVVSWLRPQETHLLAVPREMVNTLPVRVQELLGYNIYPPFLGYVDGRHPRRVLEKGEE
jgi:ectoine hydroxylase-related dioxygenase (phytanoyl-CoA dioxygenase family)